MTLPDDEQLLREVSGTKFRSPEEWANAVEDTMGEVSKEKTAEVNEHAKKALGRTVPCDGNHPKILGAFKPLPESILQEAQRLVHGDRAKAYGSPDANHSFTAKLFLEWLKGRYTSTAPMDHLGNPVPNWEEEAVCSLDAYDVCVFNMLQKLSRTAHQLRSSGSPHRDSLVDIAGYAANMDMIDQERRGRGT